MSESTEHTILLVRPDGAGPLWWPRDGEELAFVSIDPEDPPGWSAGVDDDYAIDPDDLEEQTGSSLTEYLEFMKEEWLDEFGADEDDEDDEQWKWEFKTVTVPRETPKPTS